MAKSISTPALIRWMAGITRPVHSPLLASILFRVLTQSLDITLFALAGYTLAGALTGHFKPWLLGLIVLLALARALTHYLEQFTGHYVAFKSLEVLRGHAFAQTWPKAPGITLGQHSSSLLTNLTRDIDRIEVVYAHTLAPLISALLVPALALGSAGAAFGPELTLVPTLCILISVLVIPLLGFKKSITSTEATLAARTALAAHLSDTLHGTRETLTYGRQADRLAGAATLGQHVRLTSLVPARIKGGRRAANLLLSLITLASVILTAVHLDLPLTWSLALALGALRLFEAPRGIENAVSYLDYSLSAARRLWQLSTSPNPITEGSRQLTLTHAPQISWDKVTYHYPTAAPGTPPALCSASFTAPAGQHTVLIGPSGSGKSTATQLLLRFDDLDDGQIRVDGTPISDYTSHSLQAQAALVPQTSYMLDGTLADNLRLGAPQASDDQLWQALTTACLADEIRALPQGLTTPIGNSGTQLSGGQIQRLALARALVTQPRILILDEFTASLNSQLETQIRKNLSQLQGQVTIIEISHRTEHLPEADAIYTFDQGQVRALA